MKSIDAGIIPFEIETLTETQQLNEYIMTSLRTIEGISMKRVKESWGDEKLNQLINTSQKHIARGHLVLLNDVLRLGADGKFLADGIAADLFQL